MGSWTVKSDSRQRLQIGGLGNSMRLTHSLPDGGAPFRCPDLMLIQNCWVLWYLTGVISDVGE
jgi:hypothetical protein